MMFGEWCLQKKNSKFRHEIWPNTFFSFTSAQIVWQQCLTSEQALAGCADTQARTKALMQFVQWPKQGGEAVKGLSGKKKDKLAARVNMTALKMNQTLLSCFTGYTHIYKKLGHVDFLFNLLIVVSDHWDVPCLRIFPADIYVSVFVPCSGCACLKVKAHK